MFQRRLSRRKFLKSSAISGSAALLGGLAPARSVLGSNKRIYFGVIGTGAMGTGHLQEIVKRSAEENVRCVAVCDVYRKRLDRAVGICGGQAYSDYRKLLERQDIDAVLIAHT